GGADKLPGLVARALVRNGTAGRAHPAAAGQRAGFAAAVLCIPPETQRYAAPVVEVPGSVAAAESVTSSGSGAIETGAGTVAAIVGAPAGGSTAGAGTGISCTRITTRPIRLSPSR